MRVKALVMCIFAVLAVACAGMSVCACKPSDAIVEKIHDQASPNVDYDNPNKVYVPDESAETTVQDLHMDKADLPKKEQIKRDLPDKKGLKDKAKVKDVEYSASAAPADSAAPKGAGAGKAGKDGTGEDKPKKKKVKASSGASKDDGSTEGGKSPDAETGSHGYDMDDDSYQTRTPDARYGNTEELPDDVSTIAATGEAATMALVLGKKGTLVGSSESYLSREAVQDVFESKGVRRAKAVWAGKGTSTKGADVDAIIDLAPDALVVYPGQLSSKQERVIAQNCPKTTIVTISKPTSLANIEDGMKVLAKLLKKSTDGASRDIEREYLSFAEEAVDKAKDCHGGGFSTYEGVDYGNTDETREVTTADLAGGDPVWSLYISGWDDDAEVTASYQGSTLFTDTGAAYTRTGWAWSPLSHMMSAGGVINNAAAYGPLSTDTTQPVLGINETQVSFKWKKFSVKVDEDRGGGSFSVYRGFHVLMNARDAADTSTAAETHPLGSDDFNTVIVKTKSIASALKSARKEADGLYTMHERITTGTTTGYGRLHTGKKGKSIVWTTVMGDKGYDIVVNPCGYVGSWTDGSIEAPLEALWVSSEFHSYGEDELVEDVAGFYEKFYGYDISSKTDKILDGSYAR